MRKNDLVLFLNHFENQGNARIASMNDSIKLVDPAKDDISMSDEPAPLIRQLEIHAGLLNLAFSKNDKALATRILHHLPRFGASLDATVIGEFVSKFSSNENLCKYLNVQPLSEQQTSLATEIYAWLLLTYWLSKSDKYQDCAQSAELALSLCDSTHYRCLDPLQAKLYFYFALASERLGNFVELRHKLMIAHRKTSLHHDDDSSSVIYNWILRSYVLCEQHDLARKFVAMTPFPANVNSAQTSRYHYYMARIDAVQTDYIKAREHLTLAIRKAPHNDASLGLVQRATKLLVVVQLLLGDIPERSLFSQPKLSRSLNPYLELCQAVRLGDLARFQKVVAEHHANFKADRNDSIINRLHQNVLRAGLKRLNTAYSRISLLDVSRKLGLPSIDDAEFVVLKAIKDGVIKATVDHAQQFMQSTAIENSYYTREPHAQLHHRIQTAQQIYKHSMTAMTYPQGLKHTGSAVDLENIPNDMDLMEEYMDADDLDF